MRLKEKTISANTGLDAIKRAPIVEYDTGLKCIRIQDISQGKQYDEWGFTETSEKDRRKFLLKKNDLLIARTGATVGVSKIITSDSNSVYNNGTIRLRFEKSVNPRFIYYIFQTDSFLQYIDNISCVATQPNLRIEGLLRFTIPDYSLDRQNKIVSVLLPFDELIENNNKRIKLLEKMAENLYKEWFVRFRFPGYEHVEFENGIPKGWEILRANQLFDITIGKTPDRKIFEYFSNIPECNYPWISISDMRSASTFVFKTKEYLTFNAVNTCNVKIIPKNTVLVSFKLTVGQVAITTSDMCTNEAIAHFTTDNTIMREYIYLYLKKFQYSDLGNTSSIGTAVNSKIIKNMKIILPSSELLNRFHDDVYSIFEEIRLLNETNSNLTKQRDMLLPRLMSGKLEV
jgi:hypothetical protein